MKFVPNRHTRAGEIIEICFVIASTKIESIPRENWLKMEVTRPRNYFPLGTFRFKLRLKENKRGRSWDTQKTSFQ